jgi:ABC-type transporter Mla subunit MlaD
MIRRLLAIGVVIGACLMAVVLTGADDPEAKGEKYWIEFDNAFGLVEDGEMKIGGVSAGKITDFELTDSEPPKVAVQVEVTGDDFDRLRAGTGPGGTEGATCGVRQQSLIGEYFIDCQPGTEGPALKDGGRVPVKKTFSTVPVDLVNNIQRRPYRERFRLILSELGVGLAGRPDELNEVVRRAHPGLRETTETLEILARQRNFIKSFVEDADTVSAAVEPRKTELSRWAKEASEVAEVQASRKDSIAEQWRKLPRFLAELKPTAEQLESTASEQIPLLRRLRETAPDLTAFLAELGPFSEDSRAATRALGNASLEGRRAVVEAGDEVAQLRELAEDLPRFAKPLRQFLETMDDRGRSIENDPLAAQTAPPAPDKTAYKEGQGFTGLEVIWNYIYYQTLGINQFDDVSHLLRIILVQNACAPYSSNPTMAEVKNCGSGIGAGKGDRPYMPGVFDPDPTEGPAAQAASLSPRENLERFGFRRGAGEPEAPALPGQRDISRPQVTLPPNVEELVDSLRGDVGSGAAPDPGGLQQSGQLLDFLMAP